MIFVIIIFLVSIVAAFFILAFQSWKIQKAYVRVNESSNQTLLNVPFRHIEKSMLYLTKHIIQWLIIVVVKYWFIAYTKFKKFIREKWPKIYSYFKNIVSKSDESTPPSFVHRAVIESKIKIRRVKEKIIKEHGKNK